MSDKLAKEHTETGLTYCCINSTVFAKKKKALSLSLRPLYDMLIRRHGWPCPIWGSLCIRKLFLLCRYRWSLRSGYWHSIFSLYECWSEKQHFPMSDPCRIFHIFWTLAAPPLLFHIYPLYRVPNDINTGMLMNASTFFAHFSMPALQFYVLQNKSV